MSEDTTVRINPKDFERIKDKIIDVTKTEKSLDVYMVLKYLVQVFEKEVPSLAESKLEIKEKVKNK